MTINGTHLIIIIFTLFLSSKVSNMVIINNNRGGTRAACTYYIPETERYNSYTLGAETSTLPSTFSYWGSVRFPYYYVRPLRHLHHRLSSSSSPSSLIFFA